MVNLLFLRMILMNLSEETTWIENKAMSAKLSQNYTSYSVHTQSQGVHGGGRRVHLLNI